MSAKKPTTDANAEDAGCLTFVGVMGGTVWLLLEIDAGFVGWVFGIVAALIVAFVLAGTVMESLEKKPAGNDDAGKDAGGAKQVAVARPRGRTCPRCGRQGLPRFAKFCPVCGESLRRRRRKKAD